MTTPNGSAASNLPTTTSWARSTTETTRAAGLWAYRPPPKPSCERPFEAFAGSGATSTTIAVEGAAELGVRNEELAF